MPNVTADEAGAHFARVLDDAQHDPVFVFSEGKPSAVVLSWDAFRRVIERHKTPRPHGSIDGELLGLIERNREVLEALSRLD